jgi:hypothetical protein
MRSRHCIPAIGLPTGSAKIRQRAIYHVLRTSDRITGLRGLAGSGKTTALRELVAACKEARVEPLFCAPTAAATEVLRTEGFEAVTLQSLLLTKPALSAVSWWCWMRPGRSGWTT